MLSTSTFRSSAYNIYCPVAFFKVQSGVTIHTLTINASGIVKKVPCYWTAITAIAIHFRDHSEWEPRFLRFSTQVHKQVFYCFLNLDTMLINYFQIWHLYSTSNTTANLTLIQCLLLKSVSYLQDLLSQRELQFQNPISTFQISETRLEIQKKVGIIQEIGWKKSKSRLRKTKILGWKIFLILLKLPQC